MAAPRPLPENLEAFRERFMAKTAVAGASDCWLWRGNLNLKGYGRFYVIDGYKAAHRVSYALEYGEIPAGLVIDHLCRNRQCVNPAHLEAVTDVENIRRGEAGLAQRRQAEAMLHCRKGHSYTPENTYFSPRGKRECRACTNARQRQKRRDLVEARDRGGFRTVAEMLEHQRRWAETDPRTFVLVPDLPGRWAL